MLGRDGKELIKKWTLFISDPRAWLPHCCRRLWSRFLVGASQPIWCGRNLGSKKELTHATQLAADWDFKPLTWRRDQERLGIFAPTLSWYGKGGIHFSMPLAGVVWSLNSHMPGQEWKLCCPWAAVSFLNELEKVLWSQTFHFAFLARFAFSQQESK